MNKYLIPPDLRPQTNAENLRDYEALLKDAEERGDDVACKILRRYIKECRS